MYRLDEKFLEGTGLEGMPADEKKAFLEHLQEELEVRVGERMSAGLSEAQIDEFEKIIDNDQETISRLLGEAGDYKNDEKYKKLMEVAGMKDGSPEILNEYVSMKWLEKNKPDYQQIVENTTYELKDEVARDKDNILAGKKGAGDGASAERASTGQQGSVAGQQDSATGSQADVSNLQQGGNGDGFGGGDSQAGGLGPQKDGLGSQLGDMGAQSDGVQPSEPIGQ